MSYQFYQLPDDPGTYLEFPLWMKNAIATRDIRVTADGEDVYVRTPVGEVQVEPTDYIVCSSRGNFFVLSEELFENLAGVVNPAPAPGEFDKAPSSPTASPSPQPSSGVLARSARARAAQAHPQPTPTTPDNAHVEGADTHDEPDTPTTPATPATPAADATPSTSSSTKPSIPSSDPPNP